VNVLTLHKKVIDDDDDDDDDDVVKYGKKCSR